MYVYKYSVDMGGVLLVCGECLGKLLSLWFYFRLLSILFLKTQTSYHTCKIISSNELARPVMGTIFLVCMQKFDDQG